MYNATESSRADRLAGSFKANQREVSSGAVQNQATSINLVNQMVALLWEDQQLCDAFNSKKKGWQSKVAGELSVSPASLTKAIAAVGVKEVETLVNRNPAGDAPVVFGRFKGSHPTYTDNCGTTICGTTACQTSTPCGTSTCGSCYCQSGQCIGMKPADMKFKMN